MPVGSILLLFGLWSNFLFWVLTDMMFEDKLCLGIGEITQVMFLILYASDRSLAACELLYNAGYRNLFWVQEGLEAAEEEVFGQ